MVTRTRSITGGQVSRRRGIGWIAVALTAAALACATAWIPAARPAGGLTLTPVIVQARDLATAAGAVRRVGGEITHELGIIDAVGARLSTAQRESLRRTAGLTLHEDREARSAGGPWSSITVPLVGADRLHQEGYYGNPVTIAVLDTGAWYSYPNLDKDISGAARIRVQYNAITNKVANVPDKSGHGTHVASIALSSRLDANGKYLGIAPNARLVVVGAFDQNGAGTYANVIRGINWIVANKAAYNIRVLNCSFSAPVHSWYWQDPLNQAIMKAWKAGIVVVASAGNGGPKPMTIGVPGNVPYVVTVGAMTDYYTPTNASDDRLASFSAAGPTFEGFVKPDVVAPGGHVYSTMDDGNHAIAKAHPEFVTTNDRIFQMSGTSQAAAVVSGIAALMLQKDPTLTPDDVKCGLMATADVAWSGSSTPYSVFQQGAGLVRAYDAVYGGFTRCANGGLDIAKDVAGTQHYAGPAAQDANRQLLPDRRGGSGQDLERHLQQDGWLSMVQRLPLVERLSVE